MSEADEFYIKVGKIFTEGEFRVNGDGMVHRPVKVTRLDFEWCIEDEDGSGYGVLDQIV